MDWKNLPFGYIKTNKNVRAYYRDGQWGELEETDSEFINLHMGATCLHYGQEAFEGLKAFRGNDGKIRIFRLEENAKRLNSSAREIMMAEVPENLFREAVIRAVELNSEFVPPRESEASLYIRPLLIGSGEEVGLKPAKEYLLVVFVTPVGPYFKDGFKPVNIIIDRDHDRAAPLGTGHVKVGGNYAASLGSAEKAHHEGYSSVLYLDAGGKKFIDECGPANFFAIKDRKYITPDSRSILPSITNDSLQKIATDLGLTVEKRKIPVEELAEFNEAGACGTAAIIAPIGKIFDKGNNKTYEYCNDGQPGPICTKLYERLRAIQYGEAEDKWGWNTIIN